MLDRRLKVLIDAYALRDAKTGLRTYIEELCQQVNQQETKTHDYLIVPIHATKQANKKSRVGLISKISYHLRYFFWKELQLPLLALKYRPDVILCPDHVAPFFKLKAHKIPVIHDAFFWENTENYQELWVNYYIKLIRLGLRGKSTILTTSNFSRERLRVFLGHNVPMHVIYQGSRFKGLAHIKQAKVDKLLHHYELQKEKYFLHVGVFEKRKNLTTLVKAFSKFKKTEGDGGVKLVLVGTADMSSTANSWDEIVTLIKESRIEKDIVLTGYLPKGDVECLYSSALSYVFPSYNEGFGLPVLEAFANQLPVITSCAGALKEIGGDAVLTFDTLNAEDLFQKMYTIYQERSLRKALIKNGTERLKNFTWESFFMQLEQMISKVASGE